MCHFSLHTVTFHAGHACHYRRQDTLCSLKEPHACVLQQPPTPEGRHFHQTCLGRGAHLNMSRKILHWSGRSNSNKRKKVSGPAVDGVSLLISCPVMNPALP